MIFRIFKIFYHFLTVRILLTFTKEGAKFSFIIPTIWKSDKIHDLISFLDKCDLVGEVILIDNMNCNGKCFASFNKVVIINNIENIYVNPAWNKGVEVAKYENIALCNDDVVVNVSNLSMISKMLKQNIGIIGLHHYELKKKTSYFLPIFASKRTFGFGSLMFMKKEKYVPIPNDMKIWYGDNFLFDKIEGPHFRVLGILDSASVSQSAGSSFFDVIKENDKMIYETHKKKIYV